MAIQKTEAIVLKTQPFRSSSLILTVFTRSFGKLRGLAKGVRRQHEMRPAAFELFSKLEMIFYEKIHSDLHLVSESEVLEVYPSLRSDLEATVYASYFAELVDELTEVHDPSEKIFELLDFSLRYLPSLSGKKTARLFEIKLLHEIGWLPYLEDCVHCGEARLEKGYFSARQGALLCEKCRTHVPDARPLGRDTLAAMRYYIRHDLETSIKFRLMGTALGGMESLMDRFLVDRLNRRLKTCRFIEKIKPALNKTS